MVSVFKSIWFRCIASLLIIASISGGTLAILNDALYVSASERTARAINKIYGENKSYVSVLDVDAEENNLPIVYEFGQINKIYDVDDGAYKLFQTTGYKGYKNGTITLWINVSVSAGVYTIEKVVLETFEKQTLMSRLGETYYKNFRLTDVTENYKNGFLFSADKTDGNNIVSGATKSATAGVNAVNCVLKYLGELQ